MSKRRRRLTAEELARRVRRREYGRRWRAANRLRLQDYREKNKAHRARIEWLRLLRKYGVTEDQYRAASEIQGGRCAICQKLEQRRRLAIDHDHKTGRVRGLLCWWCNNKVLAYRNTAYLLRRAAEYLESDFDIRKLTLPVKHVPLEVTPVMVTGTNGKSGLDRRVARIIQRLERDPIVHEGVLVVMTEAMWRVMHGPTAEPPAPENTP